MTGLPESSKPDGTEHATVAPVESKMADIVDGSSQPEAANVPETTVLGSALPDPISLPERFAEHFLWSPREPLKDSISADGAPEPSPPYTYTVSDELLAQVQAIVSYNFTHASRPADTVQSKGAAVEIASERSITLYCPHRGGQPVIDSVIKTVAARERADVLVLDALELAAGKYGVFGEEAGRVIDSVYEISKSEIEDSDTSSGSKTDTTRIHDFFDSLLNIAPKVIPEKSTENPESTESQLTRRIIYLRDFGCIAQAAKPIVAYILQAIHRCRTNEKMKSRVPILIMGNTPAIGEVGGYYYEYYKGERHAALRGGRDALREFLPRIKSKYPVPCDSSSQVVLHGLSAQFFLSLVSRSSQLNHESISVDPTWEERVDDMALNGTYVSIIAKDAHSEDFLRAEQDVIAQRTKDINDMLLTVSLGNRGGLAQEKPSCALLLESTDQSFLDRFLSIISPADADAIAIIAIGLSCSGSLNPPEPVLVSCDKVARACQFFLKNEQERAEWVDEEDKPIDQKDGPKEQEEEEGDPIVNRVKQDPDLSKYEKGLLQCIVNPASLSTTFKDVCIDPQVKETLRTIISLPLSHPSYFKSGILAREAITGVLLYGPPGTGKTMLCRALAHDCDARMLLVKPSDIHDMWVGESEKRARGLFELACRLAPCVVFIDEVDAIFKARGDSDSHSSWRRDVLTEFMQAMDGFQSARTNKEKGVVVVGATNRPFDIDQAVLRRLPCHMMIDFPGEAQRQSILKVHLEGETLHSDVELASIARKTEGYSGSDLKNLCVSAAMASVKDAIGNFDWPSRGTAVVNTKTPEDGVDTPEKQTDTSTDPTPRTITMAHFDHAFTEVVPSFSEEASSQLSRWHEKFSHSPGTARNSYPTSRKPRPWMNGKVNGYQFS